MNEGEQASNFPMTGGDGEYSYAKNSNMQKGAVDSAKPLLAAAIAGNLIVSSTTNSFCIADLGCSVGPNTFTAVNNIIEAIQDKYKVHGHTSCPLEFQVFFSDHTRNDFNLLFKNLPTHRQYFACGVPGSFHTRLFPKASLDLIHSSSALHWLSKVPPELGDVKSPCYNRGRVHCANAPKEVGEAYAAQFAMDMETFLRARAEELIPGGLMVILIPGRQSGMLPRESLLAPRLEHFESSLLDMAKEGMISKEKLDLFNLPMHVPTPEEMQKLIENNGKYSIIQIEEMKGKCYSLLTKHECRAGLEAVVEAHFGTQILDQLFDRYAAKIKGLPQLGIGDDRLFILLRRK